MALFKLLLVVLMSCGCKGVWQENLRPKMYVQLGSDDVLRFVGNETYPDCFNLLVQDGTSLLIGARNVAYNVSLSDMKEIQRLEWHSSDKDIQTCQVKGKDDEKCQNYIRVLVRTSSNSLFVCGTNSYKPMCRDYGQQGSTYVVQKEKNAQGICPYDPDHNSTAIYIDGELYSGTVADFSGSDPLIYREPLRSGQYDATHLNAPHFVSTVSSGDSVYFFFRETAVEYINCGKAVFSRVARICKNDRGNPHNFRDRWTSFLKARLNCSIPGEFPFYFNEIQSTTELIEGEYGGQRAQVLYAVFTTPAHSISGSAVCAFHLRDITDTFEGPFKQQSAHNGNWLPLNAAKVPEPRPGRCVNDSHTLPDVTLNFIKSHSLMDESVPAYFGEPIVVRTSLHYRFTHIAVDPQVRTPDGKAYDVLFIGTDNGKVFKAVNALSSESWRAVEPVIIEEIQVFPINVPVRNLKVIRPTDRMEDARLVVASDQEVLALRLQRCYGDKITSCGDCVALQDPYCAWDRGHRKCRTVGSPRWSAGNGFVQSVTVGKHSDCPESKGSSKSSLRKESSRLVGGGEVNRSSLSRTSGTTADIAQQPKQQHQQGDQQSQATGPSMSTAPSSDVLYSVETLSLSVVAGSVLALALGFLGGYLCGRRCRKGDDDDNLPYRDTDYEYFEQHSLARMAPEPKLLLQEEATYAEPVFVGRSASPPAISRQGGTLSRNQLPSHLTENMFQFVTEGYASPTQPTAPPQTVPMLSRGDQFGSLRSRHDYATADGRNKRHLGDGYGTARSVKKVYL